MDKYVIVSLCHKDLIFGGNAHLFWGQNSSGYTAVIQTAGVYTEDEALSIFSEDNVPIPIWMFGMKEESFISTKSGFKEIEELRLWNVQNVEINKQINLQREEFRKKIVLRREAQV